MKTYIIPFDIIGKATIQAVDKFEAIRKFERISTDEKARMWGEEQAYYDEIRELKDDAPSTQQSVEF